MVPTFDGSTQSVLIPGTARKRCTVVFANVLLAIFEESFASVVQPAMKKNGENYDRITDCLKVPIDTSKAVSQKNEASLTQIYDACLSEISIAELLQNDSDSFGKQSNHNSW